MMAYRPMVGLEVHVQLLTKSKMFCSCPVQFGSEPNTNVCPICTGMPGALPVPNREAVGMVIKTGLALQGKVTESCRFYRKNYFYPDLAKNFQVTQYDEPQTYDGKLDLTVNGEPFSVRIRRAHMEEDTGKNTHLPDGSSLVEYNRSGTPLMEIVTEPDFTSADQVREYLVQLQRLLRYIGVSTANMEEGQMRCEPTVNLVDKENGLATPKVEIKNLASFKVVHAAVEHEIKRQHWCVENDGEMNQETRRWNEAEQKTTFMRSKESVDDYMYFPEPDLVPLQPEIEWIDAIRMTIPELPMAREKRFVEEYGLPEYDARILTEDKAMADYFEEVAKTCGDAKAASNWVMGDLMHLLNENGVAIADAVVKPEEIGTLIKLIKDNTISNKIAKDIFPELFEKGGDPQAIIEAKGLAQISDEGELAVIVAAAIKANPNAVADYRGGKKKALGAIVGYVMKETRGQANPGMVNQLIQQNLAE